MDVSPAEPTDQQATLLVVIETVLTRELGSRFGQRRIQDAAAEVWGAIGERHHWACLEPNVPAIARLEAARASVRLFRGLDKDCTLQAATEALQAAWTEGWLPW
jgi:hypothetical protein